MLSLTAMAAGSDPRQTPCHVAGLGTEGDLWIQVGAGIHQQNPCTTLGQGESSHTTGGTGSNDDGVPGAADEV